MAGNPDFYPASERAAMERMTFDEALERTSAQLDRALSPAMRLTTPDPRINDVYKAIILSNLGMLVKSPDAPWSTPIQTSLMGVWSWECAHANVPMMAIGYSKELEPALRFFTERQNGIGPRSANAGPSGDVKSTKGSYSGSAVFWMNETGSVLWLMASEYRYSCDAKWLAANKASILAAWDWIQM